MMVWKYKGGEPVILGEKEGSKSNQEREYLLNTYYGVCRVYDDTLLT